MGVGVASGEYILYPYIASQAGLVFLWAAVVGVLLQFFINMEIERYTLATGQTAITGFQRLWKPWGLILVLLALLATLWPGWATSAATVTTFLFGGGDPNVIAIGALLAIGIALTASPVVYQTVERLEFLKVGALLVFIVIALFAAVSATAYEDLSQTVTSFGTFPYGGRPGDPGRRARCGGRGRREQPGPEQLDPRQGVRHGPLRTPDRVTDHRRGGGVAVGPALRLSSR